MEALLFNSYKCRNSIPGLEIFDPATSGDFGVGIQAKIKKEAIEKGFMDKNRMPTEKGIQDNGYNVITFQ